MKEISQVTRFFGKVFAAADTRARRTYFLKIFCLALLTSGGGFAHETADSKISAPAVPGMVNFGYSTAIDGNLAVVGAPALDINPENPLGKAFLYDVSDPSNPELLSELERTTEAPFDSYGKTVAISGNLALVGAEYSNAAYLFDISDPENPVELVVLSGSSGSRLGMAVSLEGNLAAVSGRPGGTTGGARAYLYDLTAPASPVMKSIVGASITESLAFECLLLRNGFLFVGDPHQGGLFGPGAVHIFDIADIETPVKQASIVPTNSAYNDSQFGHAIAASGNFLFIGAPYHDPDNNPFNERGIALVYDISDPSDPTFQSSVRPRKLIPGYGYRKIRAGFSLAAYGNELLVSGPGTQPGHHTNWGLAVLYDIAADGSLSERRRFCSVIPGEGFGHSMAYNGSVAVVGGTRVISNPNGSVSLFALRGPTPDLIDESDLGISQTDDITKETSPTFTGVGPGNSSIDLFSNLVGGAPIGSGVSDGNGIWTITVPNLGEGVHQITASDGSSYDSDALTVTIDTTAPGKPVGLDLPAEEDSGISDSDKLTNKSRPSLSGSAETMTTITLYSSLQDQVGSGAGGNSFLVPASSQLNNGEHSVTATATDTAGNESTESDPLVIHIDTVRPSVQINQASGQADPATNPTILFDVIFSEPVNGFSGTDVEISGTANPTTRQVTDASDSDEKTFTAQVGGVTGDGTVVASIPLGSATDDAGNENRDSNSTDNVVLYDVEVPSVTVELDPDQEPYSNQSTIRFRVTFSEDVIGFDFSDVTVAGTAGDSTTVMVTGTGRVFDITITGMPNDGTVSVSIAAGVVQDAAGKGNTESPGVNNTVNYDTTKPTVTINQGDQQSDPADSGPLTFSVEFSEPVSGFGEEDLVLSGRSTPESIEIVQVEPFDSTSFQVNLLDIDRDGSVTASIQADAVADNALNKSHASESTDNSIVYDTETPSVIVRRAGGQDEISTDSTLRYLFLFSEPVSGFDETVVNLSGTAAATTVQVAEGGLFDGTHFTVSVSGMTREGSVIAAIDAGLVSDQVGKTNLASNGPESRIEFDMHGGAPDSATELIFVDGNALQAGSLHGNDLDFFRFELSSARHVSIYSAGSLDTAGRLFGPGNSLLESATSAPGGGLNFSIEKALGPGTYFVETSGNGGNQSGDYQLNIDQGALARIQPDVILGKSSPLTLGDDVFNDIASQTARLISRKARTVRGKTEVENDGEVPDVLTIRGTAGNSIFNVRYSSTAGNVTSQVRAGTLQTGMMDPTGSLDAPSYAIQVTVKPSKKKILRRVKRGSRFKRITRKVKKNLTVTSISGIDQSASDSGRFHIRTR